MQSWARPIGASLFALTCVAATVRAQVPAADAGSATFEVASVKPNKSVDGRARADMAGGRFTTVNVTLRDLVRLAYPFQDGVRNDDQISGGPSWINADHFDVMATAPGVAAFDTTRAAGAVAPPDSAALTEVRVMLRNLLADRFKLKVHNEQREERIYELVLDRPDRGLGPGLKPSQANCLGP